MHNIVASSGWRTVAWAIRAVVFGLLLGMALPSLAADFADDFDDGAPEGWTAVIGTWAIDPDNAHSTAIGPADIAVYDGDSWATGFTYHVSVNNGYTGTGDLAGPVYNYQDSSNYYSVTFAPTGTAHLKKVINGTTTTVATASYSGGGPNVWFDVDVIRSGTGTTVKVNGATIFSNIVQSELGAGKIGLITTWADGRFDNVVLTESNAPFSENFDSGTAYGWTQSSGTWTVDPDNFHSTAIGLADIAVYSGGSWATDFTYHVSVNNGYTSGGNLAGPVYNYQDSSNYYSVTFAPTGTAHLKKVINGTTTTVATASYSGGGPNVWFDVDVIRSGTGTTVKVNGVTIFSNIVQSELGAGKIGLITTWADGRFDNVSLSGVTTIDDQAPSVPTGLTGTAVSATQINLTWNASTDNVEVTGYHVYLNDVTLSTTTATSFQHTGLTPGTTYNYRVSAHDAVPNHSGWTATPVSVTTTDTQAPSVPTGLTGTAVSATQINLTWNASTDDFGVTGYHVYLNDVTLGTTTATSFQHTGLTADTTYNYRVSAHDAVPNHSAWTDPPVSVTTSVPPDTQAPSVPTGLAGTAVSATQINLTWNASTDSGGGVTGYHVYLNDVTLGTTTATSFQHTGLTAGTTYNYRVSAHDAVPNHSAWTAPPVSVTTPPPPPPTSPTNLLFRSGYEGATAVGAPTEPDCFGNGCWQNLTGTDSSTGSTWPPSIWGGGQGRFQLIADAPVNATTISDYMVNQIRSGEGRNGTQALYSEIMKSGCCGTGPQGDGATQDPYTLQPQGEPSGAAGDLYVSYWLKFQPNLAQLMRTGSYEWRPVFAWKSQGDYRVSVQVIDWQGELFWMVRGDNVANGGFPYQEFWRVDNHSIAVPLDQWFKFEVFWHRAADINDNSGRVWAAVNGQVIADVRNDNLANVVCPSPAPCNTSMKGVDNKAIDRIMISTLYTSTPYPIYQWVDDLQIWNGFPTASSGDSWYDPPYAPHSGPPGQAPSVPTGLTGTAVSENQIDLTWNASTDDVGVTGYTVYLNDAVLGTTTTATFFQHTGLTAGTTYNYRVSAHDAVPNHSAWTDPPVSVTTPDQDPSVPTGLTGTAVSENQIDLTWNASTDDVGVTGYTVYLNDAVLGTTTTATFFQHTGLTAGTTYNYRVSAHDAVPNHSAWTAPPVSVTTLGSAPTSQISFPRLLGINIGAKNYDDEAYQAALAKLDVVMLGFYRGWNGLEGGYAATPTLAMRKVVQNLKTLNPDILVGQYTVMSESKDDRGNLSTLDLVDKLDAENWWLLNASGQKVQWTIDYGAWETNFTTWATPDANGERWPQWLAQRNYDVYFKDIPEFDIVYFDNVFWKPRVAGDWDSDGINDDVEDPTVLARHYAGHLAHWNRIRELHPNALLFGNTDRDLANTEWRDQLNGGLLEGVMGTAWAMEKRGGDFVGSVNWVNMMERYRAVLANTRQPKIVAFGVHGALTDYPFFRYAYTSCLLEDGYFAFTDEAQGFSSVPWFDEYNHELGTALSTPPIAAWSNGVWRRDFQNGIVLVNPTDASVTVTVEPGFRRLSGTQDPEVNNGSDVSQVTLGRKDGIVLRR